jgi:hypothetical protein
VNNKVDVSSINTGSKNTDTGVAVLLPSNFVTQYILQLVLLYSVPYKQLRMISLAATGFTLTKGESQSLLSQLLFCIILNVTELMLGFYTFQKSHEFYLSRCTCSPTSAFT